jgi:hypothetical protein
MIRDCNHRISARTAFASLFLLLCGGAGHTQGGPSSLPASTSGSLPAINPQSDNVFKRDATGVLSRTLFAGASPSGIGVIIREILVGADSAATITASPGPALLERLEGSGTVTVAGGPAAALEDQFEVVPAGKSLSISNPNKTPVGIRLYIFAGS